MTTNYGDYRAGVAVDDAGMSNPTSRQNAGFLARGQSSRVWTARTVLSTTQTTTQPLGTVPAGKTFYLTDVYLSHDGAIAIDIKLQAGGLDIFRAPAKGDTAPVQQQGIETQPFAVGGQALTLVYAAAAGPPNAFAQINGFCQVS